MATRTPGGVIVPGELVTAAWLNSLPRGVIAYVQAVANQAGITAVTDLTSLTLTLTLSASRRYRWSYRGEFFSTVADGAYVAALTDAAGVQLKRDTGPANTAGQSLEVDYSENGTGVSVTRKVRLSRASGTGTYTHAGDATNPATLTVEDVGPAFT